MILIEAGSHDARSFDARLQFTRQLSEQGHRVFIDEATTPGEMNRIQKYEAVPFLTRIGDVEITRVLIIGAEAISDDLLECLRGYQLPPQIPVTAIGYYENRQAQISTQSKLAYALGYEPALLDLSSLQPNPILRASGAPIFATNTQARIAEDQQVRLFLVIPKDELEASSTLPFLEMLSNLSGIKCNVVTAGYGKEQIRTSKYSSISAYGISELAPGTLAGMADVAVFFGPNLPGERMAAFALDLMQKAGVVIDCTENGALVATGAPAVRGPIDLGSLAAFLQSSILTNRTALGTEAAGHPWLRANSFDRLENALNLPPVAGRSGRPSKVHEPRTVFIPTNGVGLGHAQRCSLIAASMKRPSDASFAAFPSCIPMLQSKGFDCLPLVQKSDHHAEPFANDLVNYLRLRQMLRPGDRLVFDGGYVFDSVYRSILERQLSAVWIRRGLLQPGQISHAILEREKAFDSVIVPEEAFDELNTDYSFGSHVHHVGPVVQRRDATTKARADLRSRLQARFGHVFGRLVVTMLGGGEAADRSAQMQSLCAQFNARPDLLHLIVVWPDARIPAGLYGWPNSHIVKSLHALELCQASDLVVSAVGYNTFHEVLYHRIPAIFIPQMAGYMDDQERRARAASERGLAVTVLSHELLLLQREVVDFLDEGKAEVIRKNLKAISLPDIGTAAAARLIERECNHEQ